MKLSLQQKGPIAPPPVLVPMLERVSLAIRSWPGVTAATHWHLVRRTDVDGVDFYVGDEELGHIHIDGELHLATVQVLRTQLVAAGLARRFSFGGSYAGWCEASIRSDAEADHAIWLFRCNYDRLIGINEDQIGQRVRAFQAAIVL